MKLTIVGGGGFRVPQLIEAISRRSTAELKISSLCLFDVSAERLAVMESVVSQLDVDHKPSLTFTDNLPDALEGASFVFSAIRVGGTRGRVLDEKIALDRGVLGQETVGPGGYAYAFRTLPAALDLARAVAEHAPDAWVINFTNPAGIVTQAMREVLGKRVIGICDTPIGLVRRAARALGQDEASLDYDYIGLNHLGWLRSVRVDGRDLLPQLLGDAAMLEEIEEARIIGRDWVRRLGMLPNEYLFYYYCNRQAVAELQAQQQTRGQFLDQQQSLFYAAAQDQPERASALWTASHEEREATYMADARDVAGEGQRHTEDLDGGYQEVALDLMTALSGGGAARMILGISNNEAGDGAIIPALPGEAIIEVPCHVDARGPRPVALAPLLGAELGLVCQVKACEAMVIEAVKSGDRELGWRAIASHPLVDSVQLGRELFEAYRREIPEVGEVFP